MKHSLVLSRFNFESSLCGAPDSCGVYAICSKSLNKNDETILYIGSSVNMQKRIYNSEHVYMKLYRSQTEKSIYVKFLKTDNYINTEKYLIKTVKPKYNKQHKNGS